MYSASVRPLACPAAPAHDSAEDVLAIRVDKVQQHHQDTDHQQVWGAKYEPIGAHPPSLFGGGRQFVFRGLLRLRFFQHLRDVLDAYRAGGGHHRRGLDLGLDTPLAAVDVVGQLDLDKQQNGAEDHELIDAESRYYHHDSGPQDRPQRLAQSNDRKESLAFFLAVDVVRERPELGNDHHDEDAQPHEIDDAERDAQLAEPEEEEDTAGKDPGDDVDEALARHAVGQDPVQPYDRDEHEHHRGRRVTPHLGRELGEDQPVPNRPENVVAGHQQEDVCCEQQRGDALAGADVGGRGEESDPGRWLSFLLTSGRFPVGKSATRHR